MKKIFLSLLLAGATSAAFAQTPAGQGELTTTTVVRPAPTAVPGIEKPRSPQAAPYVPTEGAVQLAIRTHRPIQLINPFAPVRYGSGQEHASHDPNDPGKPKGVVLFAWSF